MLDWLFQLGDQIPDAMDPVNPKFSGTRLSSLATRVIRQLLVKKNTDSVACLSTFGKENSQLKISIRMFYASMFNNLKSQIGVFHCKIIHNLYSTNILLYK